MAWVVDTAAKIERLFGFVSSASGDGLGGRQAIGGESYSGKNVTVDSALQIATVWACVRLISRTIATLPLGLYERGTNDERLKAKDHPLYQVLRTQPNADMTSSEFWGAMVASMVTWGNAYAEKEMAGGRVISITPLRPEMMVINRAKNGSLVYRYTETGGRARDIREDRVLHLKNFSLNGISGLSPVSQARHTLGLAMATSEAAGKLYSNGLRTQGVMEAPNTLTAQQRVDAKAWLAEIKAAQARGDIPLIEGGFKYSQVSLSPADAQMLQTMSFSVEEICRWFAIPPFMIGHTEKSTSWGSGLEQQMIGFLTFVLDPYLVDIEQSINKALLRPEERGRYYAQFVREGLLRADSAGRAALYSTYAQNGIMTRNEMRERENLAPKDGGEVLTAQSNLLPLDMLGKNSAAPSAQTPPEGGAQ
jgi:HK97 family phage portal protein